MKRWTMAVAGLLALGAAEARAGVLVRIGDVDGFGYGNAAGYVGANGQAADRNGDAVLTNGDLLPDLNKNGAVATGSGDDFDLRGTAELNDTQVTAGAAVISTAGTTGSKYTDISLSTSYGNSQAANQVLVDSSPKTFGAGGAFPDGSPATLPNQPGFVFNFVANPALLDPANPIFFNLIFGDYDITPATIQITRADNSTETIKVVTQPGGEDGLIQAATATLAYSDVFDGSGNGYLKVDFNAPNEPYTAFDYVELSTDALTVAAPEPSTVLGAGLGLAAFAFAEARRRRARRPRVG